MGNRTVSYRAQTLDTPNPVARYAHRQRYKASFDRVTRQVRRGGSVLDYGCGQGDFLNTLAELRPDLSLYGYDPESDHAPERYTLVDDVATVPAGSVDVVCCFETLEHLHAPEIAAFVDQSQRMLVDGGEVTISVPVIGGPPLLLKEANRALLFRRRSDYTARELLAASLAGRPAPRPDDIRVTHKGFDFRRLLAMLGGRFEVTDTACTPFPALPWWLNSQVFAGLRPRVSGPSADGPR
jgi:2-polyprenyl-3-methyl-5-hydroxy-6-metoxy-1,4-benzoquinol methylase